ncbi:MAG: ferritin family protein [Nitrospirae bacterium]|nr:ferritin family protein [Nitrospirota bacterium]
MGKYSIREVIEQAIQTEKLGYALYLAMAERFERDEKLRRLFETLAVKEQEHEQTFTDLKEKVDERRVENWEEVSKYLRAIVESEFFLGNKKAMPSLEHLHNIEDAVRYALAFEKETLLYYHSLKDLISEKDILDKLINEEKSHIVWLSEFRKTINK